MSHAPVLRSLALRVPLLPLASGAARAIGWHSRSILTFHRFSPEPRQRFMYAGALRALLSTLRRHRVHILPLVELCERFAAREELPQRAVALTVDDGYRDFLDVAWPVFREFDAPVTVFLPTDFVDGGSWLWWDRLEASFSAAHHQDVTLKVAGLERRYRLDSDASRRDAAADVNVWVERLACQDRLDAVDEVGRLLGVMLPSAPTAEYAAMSWADVQRSAREGVQFGPHSVSHPILSLCSAQQSEHEVAASWSRLRAHVPEAVPVFSFPNGSDWTFGAREQHSVEAAGLEYAVSSSPMYLEGVNPVRFALPRFGAPDDPAMAQWLTVGLERLRRYVRRRVKAGG